MGGGGDKGEGGEVGVTRGGGWGVTRGGGWG